MIGRWLALLTEQEEDNLLTTKLVPFIHHSQHNGEDVGCLVGVALKHDQWGGTWVDALENVHQAARHALWYACETASGETVAARFNLLCQKLAGVPQKKRYSYNWFQSTPLDLVGGARAATLIRARILRHRAQRALAGASPMPTAAPVAAELVEVA